MKKRLCSILLALCMVCTVIPFPDKVLKVDAAESDMFNGIFEDDFEDGFANWQQLTIANPPVSTKFEASTEKLATKSTEGSAVLKKVYGEEFALSEDNKAVYPPNVFKPILTPDDEHSIPGRVKKISFDAYIPTTTTEYIFNFIPYYDPSDSAFVKMDGGAINDSDRTGGYARFRFIEDGSNISVSGGTWNKRMTNLDSKMDEWMHIELAYDYTNYESYEDHASNQLKITISITTVNTEREVVTNSQIMTIKAAGSGTVTNDFVFGFYESSNKSYYDNFKIEYDEFAVEANTFKSTYETWFVEGAAITQENLAAYNTCVAAYEALSDTAKNYLTEEKTQLDQLAVTYYKSAVAKFEGKYAKVLGYELSDITFDMYDDISEAYTSAEEDYDAADSTLQAALAKDFTKIKANYDYAKKLHTLYTENYFYDDFEDGFANWQTLTMVTSPVSTELEALKDKLVTKSTVDSAVLKKLYGEDFLSADNKVVYTQNSVTSGQILTPDKEHSIPGRVEKISFDAYIPTTTSETVFMFIPYYNPSSGSYIKMGGGNFDGVASDGDARFRIFPENSISVTGDVTWNYRATDLDCKMDEWMHMELDYDYSNYVSYGDSTSNKLKIIITVTTTDATDAVVEKTSTVTINETKGGATINDFIFGFRNNSDQSYYDNFKIEYDEYAVKADGFRSIYESWFTEGAAITEDTVTDYSACVADYKLLSDTAKNYLTEEKVQLDQLAADYCKDDIDTFKANNALLLADDLSYIEADNYETIKTMYEGATEEYNSANAILKDALTEYYTKIEKNYNYATPFYTFVEEYKDLFTATTSDITDDTVKKLTAFVNDFSALDEALQAKVKEECNYENVVSLRIFALNQGTLVNEDFEGEVKGATDKVKYVEGYNGKKAAYFKNNWGKGAEAYVDFGEVQLGEGSFAISYWYKAGENGGASEWAPSGSGVADVDFDGFLSITKSGKQLGGTVFANKDFSTNTSTGIAVANMQRTTDMSVNAVIGESAPVQFSGIQTAVDTRWHSVIISVNRGGKLSVYVDGELSYSVEKITDTTSTTFHESDISALTGTLDSGNFVLGADAKHNYGLRDATVDSFKIYSDYITEEEAATMYACEKLGAKINEVENRIANYTAGTRFSNEDIATVKKALSVAKAVQVEADCSNYKEVASAYDALRTAFENFLLGNPKEDVLKVVQIASDTHIYMNGDFIYTGSDKPEEMRFETLLKEAEKLGFKVDTYLNAGDLSETSGTNAQKKAFEFYRNHLNLEKTLVVQAMGNHDEDYAYYDDTSGTYNKEGFIDRLQEYGLVDAALEYNKDLFDEGGNLTTAYYYATDGAIHYVVLSKSPGRIDDTELTWLKNVMDNISKDGKPIFIVDHYTPSYDDYSNFVTRTKEVVEAIDYPQVYYFCGHAHNGLGYATATTYSKYAKNMLVFNLPSSGKADSSVAHANSAYYYLFYYEDCMVLRARDSVTYEWLTEYDIELPIQMDGPSIVGVGVYKDTNNQSVGFKCNLGTLRDREGVTVTEYGMIATLYSSIQSGAVSYEDMTYDAESGDKSELINVGTSTQNPTVQSNMEFTAHVGKIAPEDYGVRYVVRVYVKYSDGVVVYSNNTTEGGSIKNATGAVGGYACNSVINVAKWIITNIYGKDDTLVMSEIVSNLDGTKITWAKGATDDCGTKILQWIADNSTKINKILAGNE